MPVELGLRLGLGLGLLKIRFRFGTGGRSAGSILGNIEGELRSGMRWNGTNGAANYKDVGIAASS